MACYLSHIEPLRTQMIEQYGLTTPLETLVLDLALLQMMLSLRVTRLQWAPTRIDNQELLAKMGALVQYARLQMSYTSNVDQLLGLLGRVKAGPTPIRIDELNRVGAEEPL